MRSKERESLETILASVSDVLFPEEMGSASVAVDSVDCLGDTPLHVLARRPNLYGARLLLEAGADPNAVGDMGETPLHIAVSIGSAEMVSLLLENGADPEIVSEFGDSPKERASNMPNELRKLFRA